jgi:hypothetical protein
MLFSEGICCGIVINRWERCSLIYPRCASLSRGRREAETLSSLTGDTPHAHTTLLPHRTGQVGIKIIEDVRGAAVRPCLRPCDTPRSCFGGRSGGFNEENHRSRLCVPEGDPEGPPDAQQIGLLPDIRKAPGHARLHASTSGSHLHLMECAYSLHRSGIQGCMTA